MHIFGKGAGARGGDGGERGKQLWLVILSAGSVAKIELDRDQERGQKKVVVEKSCQNKVCSIFDAN